MLIGLYGENINDIEDSIIERDIAADAVVSEQNRDPWLAACLSAIIPGMGQFYAGRKLRGILFFLAFCVLWIFWYILLVGSQSLLVVSAEFLIPVAFGIWMLVDAYQLAKQSNTPEFEADRKIRKNPWKVVFFSSLLYGSGYFVVGKKFVGVLAMIVIVLLGAVTNSIIIHFLAMCVVCLHGYKLARGELRFKELIIVVLAIVCIVTQPLMWATAYALRYSVAEAFVNSTTMDPTIKKQDRVIANKLSYQFEKPKAGDIIVVRRQDWDKPIIKRIAAVGGERVRFDGAVLYVNDVRRDFEGLGYNSIDIKAKESWWPRQYGMGEEYIVPEGQYYVIGDNLAISWDSRNFGAISPKEIIGKVTRTYWPLQRTRVFK